MTTPIDPENPKDIVGSRKPPLHLIPLSSRIAMAMALKDGVGKYGPFNWRAIRIKASPYVRAAQSHIGLWFDCSEECAKDSGVHHLGHALATLAILYDALVNETLVDDRPIPSKASELMDYHTEQAPPALKECTVVIADVEVDDIPAKFVTQDECPDCNEPAPGPRDAADTPLEMVNLIDPSTWCDDKRGTNTWDNGPVEPEAKTADDLESGTFFVDYQQDVCQVLFDNEQRRRRVACLSVSTPYIRPVAAGTVRVDRVLTREEANLLCS